MRRMRGVVLVAVLIMIVSGCSTDETTTTTAPVEVPTTTAPAAAATDAPNVDQDGDPGIDVADGSCTPESLPTINPGILTVAAPEDRIEPWYVDGDPTNAQGFEAGIVYATAGALGFSYEEVEWVTVPRADIETGIGDFDIAVGRLPLTTNNLNLVDHSVPYFYRQRALVAAPDHAIADVTDLIDLSEYTLGVVMGSSDADYTVQVAGSVEPSIYETIEEAYASVANGDIDGVIVSTPFEVDPSPFGVETVAAFPAGDIDGDPVVAVLPDASPLLGCIDEAIQRLLDDGVANSLAIGWIPLISDVPVIGTESLKTEIVLDEVGLAVDFAYHIPAGSWDRYLDGEVLNVMPTEIDAVIGQIVEITNDDDVGYIIGPFYVGPNETMRQRFLSVGEFFGRCAVSTSGEIVVRVSDA